MTDLLVYQKPHVEKLMKALHKYNVEIDASDTGTGKTYCALYCAKLLGFKPLIICPKAVLTSWRRVARALDIEIEFITNYDQIISHGITNARQQEQIMRAMGLIMNDEANLEANEEVKEKIENDQEEISILEGTESKKKGKKTSTKKVAEKSTPLNKPYLKYCNKVFESDSEEDDEGKSDTENKLDIEPNADSEPDVGEILANTKKAKSNKNNKKDKPKVKTFNWTLPEKTLLIFDEVHRCKNIKTLHYKILGSIKRYLSPSIKCLVLSATVADKIKYFAPVGYVLGWITDCSKYAVWLNRKAHETGFPKSKTLHHLIFPFHGSRMKISELGDLFPKNQVIAECYDMENAKEIEAQYEIIKKCIEDLRQKKNDCQCILAQITRARQMIELLKYPTFCELIEDHLDSGLSVVVFVNFTDTLNKLAKTFETGSVIHGQQTETERNKVIDAFQTNQTNLIIANIKAGGVGISLHDVEGGHQRVSIISPTWSAQDTVQTLGRIHRAEGKTPALQKFVFCSGTIEEYICDKLKEKLDTLSTINDGVLHPYSTLMEVPDTDSEDEISDNESESDKTENNTQNKTKSNKTKSGKTKSNTNQKKTLGGKVSKVKSASAYLDV